MANFSPTNYESPVTGVDLKWPKPPRKGEPGEWHPGIIRLWNSFKDNDFSKFYYQSDVEALWLTCDRYNRAYMNPDTTAAGWKALDDQLGKFGATMKDRASIRYTTAKTKATEDYSAGLTDVLKSAFDGDDN